MIAKQISILGCGWLGLPLAEQLIEQGWAVKGSTTTKKKLDMLKSKGIAPHLIQVEKDGIQGTPESFLQTETLMINIPPGRRNPGVEDRYPKQIELIYQMALKNGVKRLLFISSTGVFGSQQGVVNEESKPEPNRPTGRALVEVEYFLLQQKEMTCTIIRMGGLVGPDRNPGRFLAGKKEVANPNGVVNMIHLHDCIGIIQAVLDQEAWGKIFHGVHPHHPNRKEYYRQKANELGLTPPTFTGEGDSGKRVESKAVHPVLGYTFKAAI